jgi:hypothetical protein
MRDTDWERVTAFATTLRRLSWVAAAAVLALPLFSPGSPVSLVKVAQASPSLTITGDIDGLVPGRPGELVLTLHNADASAAVVRGLSAAVTTGSAGCPASALAIEPWRGRVVVPAHDTATVPLAVRLSAPAGTCGGATWTLTYTSF